MLYIKCPTCKMLLGDKQVIYEKLIQEICKDCDIGKISAEKGDLLKQEVVNSMGLERYCCKMRLMTFKKLIEIVK
jgi:DNA-directed RNA polymerase subunit N (RpoN/RPB10)